MATLSGDRSQFQILVQAFRMKKKIYTQVHLDEGAYTHGLDVTKSRMRIHALSCKEKRVYVGELTFGLWYLVLDIRPMVWTMVSRQKC